MNVTFFHRERREGNFSIEELFNNIQKGLSGRINCTNFYSYPEKFKSILKARQVQGDVNHITGDVNYLAYGLKPAKTVLTVHDLGHYEITLKGLKKVLYKHLWLTIPLMRVCQLTAISHFTKSKILKYINISERKIKVIYNPYPSLFKMVPQEFNSEKPVILQIGSGQNKNIERLIHAVQGLPCKLVLIRRPDTVLINELNRRKIEHEFLFDLTHIEVYQKYIECDLVYFASTYEGYGLPIVEANATGRPVITGNTSSMPEIAGKAACLVNPFDTEDIRRGLMKIIHDTDYRYELIQNGLENIQRFDTENICNQYLQLYKEIIDK